jgi:hypothetical protein
MNHESRKASRMIAVATRKTVDSESVKAPMQQHHQHQGAENEPETSRLR